MRCEPSSRFVTNRDHAERGRRVFAQRGGANARHQCRGFPGARRTRARSTAQGVGGRAMSKPTVDRIRRDLRGLAAPEPPPDLLEKILASRGSGIRVVLPRARRDYTRWILAAFAAAAAAV